MSSVAGPSSAPSSAPEWAEVELPGRAGFFVRRAPAGGYVYLPQVPRVALDAEGRPRVALTLVLARMPAPSEASIAPLVMSGSLALVCTFAAERNDASALVARLGAHCTPFFLRSGSCVLGDNETTYVSSTILGAEAQWWLGVSLPPKPALDVLYAFDRVPSSLRVVTELPDGPAVAKLPLAALLGGILDDLDRSRYLSVIVVNPDGTTTPVPPLQQHVPGDGGIMRGAPTSVPLVAQDARLVSLPFAMAASHAVQPSAAALIASSATSGGTMVNAHAHIWMGNDAVLVLDDAAASDPVPSEHFPLVSDVAAPYWRDAVDNAIVWYAPAFALVTPAAKDDIATAAFSFVLAKTSPAMGPGGTMQAGLTATVQVTVKQVMSPETTAAIAADKILNPRPVPLQNISCALEIPYRQSGSNTVLTQRFPGTVVQNGDQIKITVGLLDDWVRLSYSALAYPSTTGMAPRIVVDYGFMSYSYLGGFTPTPPGVVALDDVHIIGGGLVHKQLAVDTTSELPSQVSSPTLVRHELMVVCPTSSLQYQREVPGAARALSNRPLSAAAVTLGRPDIVYSPWPLRRRLITRSLVREEIVAASLPCANYGNFYLQQADGGGSVAIGCQDSLKLGDTALHAFDEIAALRDPSFRIYRSLQQPGRFLLAPAAYRVGRYGAGAGNNAFRPMIMLYGVLDSDPAKNRYALTATLIPDLPPATLAKLNEQLAAYEAAGRTPVVVYPTDPFVAAKVSYAWAIPKELDTPEALTVLDSVNVTLSMPLADAALLTGMIDRSGVQGGITFTLPDGTAINAALTVDSNVVGPPESGPVTVSIQGTTATLQNRTPQTMNVADLVTVTANGTTRTLPVNTKLAPGASATAVVDATAVSAFADANPASPGAIDELDVFVEDVSMTVSFINQINFANHQLSALRVQARLKDNSHVETADIPEGKTADVSFTLPITTYLAHQTLQYALVETKAGASVTAAWRDWDLNKGSVIGITADQL